MPIHELRIRPTREPADLRAQLIAAREREVATLTPAYASSIVESIEYQALLTEQDALERKPACHKSMWHGLQPVSAAQTDAIDLRRAAQACREQARPRQEHDSLGLSRQNQDIVFVPVSYHPEPLDPFEPWSAAGKQAANVCMGACSSCRPVAKVSLPLPAMEYPGQCIKVWTSNFTAERIDNVKNCLRLFGSGNLVLAPVQAGSLDTHGNRFGPWDIQSEYCALPAFASEKILLAVAASLLVSLALVHALFGRKADH